MNAYKDSTSQMDNANRHLYYAPLSTNSQANALHAFRDTTSRMENAYILQFMMTTALDTTTPIVQDAQVDTMLTIIHAEESIQIA